MGIDPASQSVLLGDWPPDSCLSGTATTLDVGLSEAIVTLSPDPPFDVQQLAAFEVELHFDHSSVCVEIVLGAEFEAVGALCIVEDTWPLPPGVERIGCVTIGKGLDIDELAPLAHVNVYPRREFYLQLASDPDHSIALQFPIVNCDLGDEQGNAIALDACTDGEIAFALPTGSGDDDGDGCTNDQEIGLDETIGGQRGALNPWDFYDVAIAGAIKGQDKQIDLFNDIVSVIDHYAPVGTEPEYDAWYDRGPSAGPNAWNMTAPDGKIDLFNDIMGVIGQFGHNC